MDENHPTRDENSTHGRTHKTGDQIGEAAGSASGVVVGAAIGSFAGPVGTVVGAVAGAIGGWWAGRAVADAAQGYSPGDDAVYRNHYESSGNRLADRNYDAVSPAYRLGHLAGHNPDYRGRQFSEIEPELRRGWDSAASKTHGNWNSVRAYANDAYDRSVSGAEQQRLRDAANDAANDDDKRLDDAGAQNIF